MSACSFEKLVQLMDKKLSLDEMLDVYDHLDSCQICRDAVYQITRDRDEAFFVRKPFRLRLYAGL